MDANATIRGTRGLREAERCFNHWRRSREGRGRIPEHLWQMAVSTAAVHGVYATARRLRLNPTALKKRTLSEQKENATNDTPQFLEFPWLGTVPAAECILEAEDQAGRKLRIHLKGGATAQAFSLGRMLWRDEE